MPAAPLSFLISLAGLLAAVICHEYAHGLVAYKLGDPTAKYAGRLTLNPIAHIDPVGTILVPLGLALLNSPVVFGWAKPVPINFLNLRNPRRGVIWVGLAGPISNFLMALAASLVLRSFHEVLFLNYILSSFVTINLVLAVFNIMPIPPLDGSRVLLGLLPARYATSYARLEPYGMIILVVFLYLGLAAKVVWPIVALFRNLLLGLGIKFSVIPK